MSDMSRKEAIEVLKDIVSKPMLYSNFILDACRVAIASLETDEAYNLMYEQPEFCANCIDREATKAAIRKAFPNLADRCDINSVINMMPSVLPKAKKGHWIKEDRGRVEYSAVCSECGDSTFWSEKSNFCPNCGAKLESEDNK